MVCPYCGVEMRAGYIFATRAESVRWLPKGETPPFFEAFSKKGIRLDSGKFIRETDEIKAELCPKCKKIIIDVADKKFLS